MKRRLRLTVRGMVQGVGFRPYVYRLATSMGLTGHVRNDLKGATIEIEGDAPSLQSFQENVAVQLPPLASIWDLTVEKLEPVGDDDFRILESRALGNVEAAVLPDVATCSECAREILSPDDRRYEYAFTNCTNCGPRYTILRRLPYDRPNTSMSVFGMCPLCRREYDDPRNRRFHAQPNACPVCGPHPSLLDRDGNPLPGKPIEEAARSIAAGLVVAVKGLGGFHLAVDATNERAVALLRERKHRWEKPMAVMATDPESVARFAVIDEPSNHLLVSPLKPIVLLPKRDPFPLAEGVSPRNRKIGVMLPYTPLHILLMRHGFLAIVLTSGNLSEEPIAYENEEAMERLGPLADVFLVHNRDIVTRCDDSVISATPRGPAVLRRSRGMVPSPLPLPVSSPSLLAVGGELKNAVCLARDTQAFVSQHIGDLQGRAAMQSFRDTIRKMGEVLQIEPRLVVHDLHPDYRSTVWAQEESGLPTLAIQHHHAHTLACMAEHGLNRPVIGLTMDGAGYGSDGTTWGGEVLLVNGVTFERLGRFTYIPLPGGDQAAKEPWRTALSYVHLLGHRPPHVLARMAGDVQKLEAIVELLGKPNRFPQASSCGRLFDAVAALTGLRGHNRYEAQAPTELEWIATVSRPAPSELPYSAPIREEKGCWVLAQHELVQGVLDDIGRGLDRGHVSWRFHVALAHALAELALKVSRQSGIGTVALTGGCFHNEILASLVAELLEVRGLEVLEHHNVPAGDGGEALGQAFAGALASR